ncbi:MAG: hypothetical protein KIT25_21235 [Enhydrobacter sp.]|nr:MAG: hypothetical protein KIT25_21235 [Enhydrobacter sp.]
MKLLRILVWLAAAVTLVAPPVVVHAAPPMQHADMDCSDMGDAKHTTGACCPTVVIGYAVMPHIAADMPVQVVDRLAGRSSSLDGLLFTRDPPPPRV